MSQSQWNIIKQSKNFYVKTYRNALTALTASIVLNIILGVGIYYVYFTLPEPDFYATSGVTPPIQLKQMSAPNYSSNPLLKTEPKRNEANKVIPK